MAGFFSSLGAKVDELADVAVKKASEINEIANEKIEVIAEKINDNQVYTLKIPASDEIEFTGTRDEIIAYLKRQNYLTKYDII